MRTSNNIENSFLLNYFNNPINFILWFGMNLNIYILET